MYILSPQVNKLIKCFQCPLQITIPIAFIFFIDDNRPYHQGNRCFGVLATKAGAQGCMPWPTPCSKDSRHISKDKGDEGSQTFLASICKSMWFKKSPINFFVNDFQCLTKPVRVSIFGTPKQSSQTTSTSTDDTDCRNGQLTSVREHYPRQERQLSGPAFGLLGVSLWSFLMAV
ncbi:hypothetical protein N42HA_00263 [Lactococcus lactis]|nr:hypothetical protein [Lactococcus lactis]